MNNEKIIVAALAVALIATALLAGFMVLGFNGIENNSLNYQKFASAENPDDICAVPAGTDPGQWREHLSHHPDRYAQCLA